MHVLVTDHRVSNKQLYKGITNKQKERENEKKFNFSRVCAISRN